MSESEESPTGAAPGGSALIAVTEFPRMWSCLNKDDLSFEKREVTDEFVAKELGVESSIAKELANVCSMDSLHTVFTQGKKFDTHYSIIDGVLPEGGELLHTVRNRAANRGALVMQNKLFHYNNEDLPAPDDPVVLLTISVTISNKVPPTGRMVKHDRELIVHADQSLSALKDKLVCPLDLVYLCGECSEAPETADDTLAQDLYKSSFFFIENTFYNDTRDSAARDISEPVRQWLAQGRSHFFTGDMKCAKMEETIFNDLKVKLGFPYLYVHQGDCEHMITFTDIRYMHDDDCKDMEQYPLLSNRSIFYKVSCIGCKVLTAKWMTQEDFLSPSDPSFFCDVCYFKLHYDSKGNKLGSFKAYRHVDPSIFR